MAMTSNNYASDPLPTLATFVAATLYDRALLEQLQETLRWKSQWEASQRVEITGPGGSPALAVGSLTEGHFRVSERDRGHDILWDVRLETLDALPLDSLARVEVRIGGVLFADEIDGTSVAVGIRPGNRFDDADRGVVCEFVARGASRAFLTFAMRDFPDGSWKSLQRFSMLNRSIAVSYRERRRNETSMGHLTRDVVEDHDDSLEEDDEYEDQVADVYEFITCKLSVDHPNQKANITSISFCAKSIRGAIETLKRGEEFERMKREYLK